MTEIQLDALLPLPLFGNIISFNSGSIFCRESLVRCDPSYLVAN